MGTRADFYVGRGESAEWLGSIAWDGYEVENAERGAVIDPENPAELVASATNEGEYRDGVAKFLASRDDRSMPSDGWPWPWDTSSTTDYAYAFDEGKLWISVFGHAWYEIGNVPKDENGDNDSCSGGKVAVFPSMKDRKRRPLFGKHSGVIVVGG